MVLGDCSHLKACLGLEDLLPSSFMWLFAQDFSSSSRRTLHRNAHIRLFSEQVLRARGRGVGGMSARVSVYQRERVGMIEGGHKANESQCHL